MPTLLDANAVLRYLLADNDEQAGIVEDAIRGGTAVDVEVIAECVYVLQGVYRVPRSRIAESLGILLDEVDCARGSVVSCALGLYSGGSLDFVDCVLAAEHDEAGRDVLTFDKRLNALMNRLDDATI